MPWSETGPMDQRTQFVTDARRGHEEFSALCERYGVSRKTGYKWLERYASGGVAALLDRSRGPTIRRRARIPPCATRSSRCAIGIRPGAARSSSPRSGADIRSWLPWR